MSWIPAVAEFALAGILAASSSAKLGSFSDWREAVSRYGLGRRNLPFAIVVPIAELGVAAALTIAIEPLAAVLATSLAVVFAVALLVGMRKRLDDCGCFGNLAPMRADRAALGRIVVFSLLAFIGSWSPPLTWPTLLVRIRVVVVIALVVMVLASHRTELRRARFRPEKDEVAATIRTEPRDQNLSGG
jgi:hypothetical protein